MLVRDDAKELAAICAKWRGDRQPQLISPTVVLDSDWKLTRQLFQSDCMHPLPADAQILAAGKKWAGIYASTGGTKGQVAAAVRLAKFAREISCIRAFRKVIISSDRPTDLTHKNLMKLVALDRCERLATAAQSRAEDYLMRTAYEPEVFCQNEPKSPREEVHKTTQ